MTNVVLLPGWGMNAAVFDDLAARLSPHYPVGLFDLPGYGTHTSDPYTFEQLAMTLAARAPERCFVVAWSLGAQVALHWAHAAPRQVERLALIGATPCFVQRADWKPAVDSSVFKSFVEAVNRDCSGTLNRFISLQAHGDDSAKRVALSLRSALAARALPDADVLERGLQLLLKGDLREILHTIEQPTLVVHGERDQLVPLDAARKLAQTLRNGRLTVIKGAAHAPFVSDPDAVGRLLLEFFE